jgi:hypothetical protein
MAIKSFVASEVLSAADTNTYLANAGLVYVTSATIGSGVSSFIVPNAFNSTYDNYLVRVDEVQYSAANDNISLQLRIGTSTSATNYLYALPYSSYAGATGVAASSTATSFSIIGRALAANAKVSFVCNINQPFLALNTTASSIAVGSDLIGPFGGYHNQNTSYDQIVMTTSGTMTGGKVTVFGYRKP